MCSGHRAAISVLGTLVAQGAVLCMCGVLVVGLLYAARAPSLAYVGGLAFLMCVCLRWFPALVSDCLYMPHHHVSL